MALPLLHAGTGAGGVPNVGALKWSSGGAFVWSDDDYIVPSLDLNFALFKDLRPRIGPTPTFTRASGNATYFNSSGVLITAAINGPRFDHVYNGVSWVSKGLLIEEARTNSVEWSEDFSNATWSKLRTSISANAFASPDGNTTADKLVEDSSASNTHLVTTVSSITASVFSICAKAAERSWIALQKSSTGNFCYFNLSSGTVGSASGATGSINSVGNGWYRCTIAVTSGSSGWDIFLATGDNGASYTGNGTSGAYIWGAQLESGSFPTSYIPTTTAAVTRSADICQISGTDFSGFWNQTEGSVVLSYDMILATLVATTQRVFTAWNAGFTSGLVIADDSGGCSIEVNPGASFAFGSSVSPTNVALGYKVNDFATGRNGGAVLTDTSGAGPSGLNAMYIGNNIGNGSNMHSGHIARLRYFNTRLTNSQLQVLST